jgi:FtsZ-interacting cell division protein ZipA
MMAIGIITLVTLLIVGFSTAYKDSKQDFKDSDFR